MFYARLKFIPYALCCRTLRYAVPTQQRGSLQQLPSLGVSGVRGGVRLQQPPVRTYEAVRHVRSPLYRHGRLHHRRDLAQEEEAAPEEVGRGSEGGGDSRARSQGQQYRGRDRRRERRHRRRDYSHSSVRRRGVVRQRAVYIASPAVGRGQSSAQGLWDSQLSAQV